MTTTVRLPDGSIVPELAVCLRGARELDKLEQQGITVDRARANTWELGRAAILADGPTPLTDAQRLLLAKIEQRNQVERARLGQVVCSCSACAMGRGEGGEVPPGTVEHDGPDGARGGVSIESEGSSTDVRDGIDQGPTGSHADQRRRNHRRAGRGNRVRSVSYVDAEEDDGYEPF